MGEGGSLENIDYKKNGNSDCLTKTQDFAKY